MGFVPLVAVHLTLVKTQTVKMHPHRNTYVVSSQSDLSEFSLSFIVDQWIVDREVKENRSHMRLGCDQGQTCTFIQTKMVICLFKMFKTLTPTEILPVLFL